MRSSLASSLASSAPTMRLRPQCRKEARTDTKVTSQAACLPLLAIPASLRMPFFAMGASATADPVMMIRHICIAKASSSHRPLYQFWTICIGVCRATTMPRTNAMRVSTTAKILGSGMYFIDHLVREAPTLAMTLPSSLRTGFDSLAMKTSPLSLCLFIHRGASLRPVRTTHRQAISSFRQFI